MVNTSDLAGLLAPTHYVGIGASAGGLEAVEAFFKHMPPDSGCAFIVVQHLSPDHKSLMKELLAKRTDMPVHRAKEGMLVEKNHVYLIPPNHDLRIFHGKLLLTEQNRHGGLNLPIDIFLASLAEDQGEKSVAVILSGTGSDGTRGVRAIKERVGMVMVQSEQTATFDGMPRSAMATGLVDYILSPEEMPEQLSSYIHHPFAKQSALADTILSEEESFNRIYSLLREKTSVDFTYYKPSTMVRRIERRMSVNQILSMPDYIRFMERYPAEIETLYRDLLIGVTSFFRDSPAFELLQNNWLPELLQRTNNGAIRIWTAGCSTGEEAYTLAMLFQEVMANLNREIEVKIFATDVDKEAIATAGAGVYPESISADIPAHLLSKYFHRRDKDYLISRQIREMVVFAQHNVIKDPPFTNIELISCRNLLIYLQPVLQQRVMELFNFSLNPKGVLFLGTSETTGEMGDHFEPLHHKWKIYRSRGRKRRDTLTESAISFDANGRMSRPVNNSYQYRPHTIEEERIVERLLQGASGRFLPFTMVINDRMELLHMNGDASGFLQFPSGRMINDVTKLARKDLAIPLATGIQKVLKSQESIDYSNIRLRDSIEANQSIDMHICLLPKSRAQDTLLGVFIKKHSDNVQNSFQQSSDSYDLGKEAEQRISDLEQELQFTRENLQATVEELETSNEELQATNEELLASNEELQSTNEELQSVNEELYTVNAEHQSKISELTEVNNDLDNLLTNIGIPTLFLDQDLVVRRFTPEITHFIRIIAQDIGRPFNHLNHDLINIDLELLVEEINRSHDSLEQEVQDRFGNNYLMRIAPYRVGPDFYSGLLITFVNLNSVAEMRKELQRINDQNNLAQEAANFCNWDWNIAEDRLDCSNSIEQMLGMRSGQLKGSLEDFLNVIPQQDRNSVRTEINRCLQDPDQPYEIAHRIGLPDGSFRWMLANGKVYVDKNNKPERMVGIIKDITEKHVAEEARRRSERLFRSTLENLDMIALQLNQEGNVIFANEFTHQFLGWEADQLIGEQWIDVCVPETQRNEVRNVFSRFIGGNAPIVNHFENAVLCKNGSIKQVYWNNTALHDDEGNPVGVSSIGQPVES